MKINRLLLEAFLSAHGSDQHRGIGRSTGAALECIGRAMKNPGVSVQITDHHSTREADRMLFDMTRALVKTLGLKYITFYQPSNCIQYNPFVEIEL